MPFEYHLFRVYSKYRLTFAFVFGDTYYTTDIHRTRYCFQINWTLRDVKIVITQWHLNSHLPPFLHAFCSLYAFVELGKLVRASVLYISRKFWIFTLSLKRCHWWRTNTVMKSAYPPSRSCFGSRWHELIYDSTMSGLRGQHKHGNKPRGSWYRIICIVLRWRKVRH